MKKCFTCKKEKVIDDFYVSVKNTPWRSCKECVREQSKKKIPLTKVMHYKDYLKQQGQYEYYKKSLKYRL